ncbi:uncharacterized protein N7477_010147 [Penicillium maclennaniae]|uniref:uncharacterized protein n=1 Tax=Penicillium maclennaniae TaxID=1343394 RepID=UPI0025426668|nr:uncharacterized protein N7477_010147 [Penicillium maclennaniae]KAJ5662531.1 hypothetical protein N7477_010147 [Penicillium maclennaniae]
MLVLSREAVCLPVELILYIARFLRPDDIMKLLQAAKGLDNLLTFHHFAIKGEYGESFLHHIARNGDEKLMKMFFAKAMTSAVRHDHIAQLHSAATPGQIPGTRSLACASVSLNELDRNRETPLHWAAKQGHHTVVRMLLDRDDIQPDRGNSQGRTPLSFAAERGHTPVVDLLLRQNNVNVNSKDYYDRTPLSFAAEHGHIGVVELMLQQDNIEADAENCDQDAAGRYLPEDGGRTPLSFAAGNGHLAVVELLVQRDDVDADLWDDSHRTPLWWAAKHDHLAVVELLMRRDDVAIDLSDPSRATPILLAARPCEFAMAELLARQIAPQTDSQAGNDHTLNVNQSRQP